MLTSTRTSLCGKQPPSLTSAPRRGHRLRIRPSGPSTLRLVASAAKPSPRIEPAETPRSFEPYNLYPPLNIKLFQSPGTYVQAPGALAHIGTVLQPFRYKHAGIVTNKFIFDKYGSYLLSSLLEKNIEAKIHVAGPESSWNEVLKAKEALAGCDVIIGFGGGKLMDTARVAAYNMNLQHVLVPTLASTDAPGTSLAVIYKDSGEFDFYQYLPMCAQVVLMDTAIVAAAPRRYIVSGFGDGMSTYFEARAVRKSGAPTLGYGKPTLASFAIATACKDTLFAKAVPALQDIEAGHLESENIEAVVEANTLLSGVGASTCGLAAAHGIHNGLTALPECDHNTLHGEKVSFATVAQLMLEQDVAEARKVAEFNASVGLPLTFEDLFIDPQDTDALQRAAKKSLKKGETTHHLPFPVTEQQVVEALVAAHKLGVEIKGRKGMKNESKLGAASAN